MSARWPVAAFALAAFVGFLATLAGVTAPAAIAEGGAPAPAAQLRPVAGQPESAAGLAQRLGLRYEDGGTYVLLSDGLVRVRVYPNTHMLSLDGQDHVLRGRMSRSASGVWLPGPAVGIVEQHVAGVRARRAAVAASGPVVAPPAPAPAPAASRPAPPGPSGARAPAPRPAAAPAAPRPGPLPAGAVAPEPGWAVAASGREWRWIVLHHSDDVSGCLAKYHQVHLDKGWEHGCGYHFVIGNGSQTGDGAVEVSNRWRQQLQGAHAKTPDNLYNEHGIGVCLVGNFEVGDDRPTAAQMRALVRLTQYLIDRYGIPPARVLGHCDCKPTCCPGKNFPWAELRSQLRPPARAGGVAPTQAPAAPAQPLAVRWPALVYGSAGRALNAPPPGAGVPGPARPAAPPAAPAPAPAAIPPPRWTPSQLGAPPADAPR